MFSITVRECLGGHSRYLVYLMTTIVLLKSDRSIGDLELVLWCTGIMRLAYFIFGYKRMLS